jgi:hypothetical protein
MHQMNHAVCGVCGGASLGNHVLPASGTASLMKLKMMLPGFEPSVDCLSCALCRRCVALLAKIDRLEQRMSAVVKIVERLFVKNKLRRAKQTVPVTSEEGRSGLHSFPTTDTQG